jgi:hypothetical protein
MRYFLWNDDNHGTIVQGRTSGKGLLQPSGGRSQRTNARHCSSLRIMTDDRSPGPITPNARMRSHYLPGN